MPIAYEHHALRECHGGLIARWREFLSTGRLVGENQDARTVQYAYDAPGNRTQILWPDSQHADYGYDARNQLALVCLDGAAASACSGGTNLAGYSYDIQGRGLGASFGNCNSASLSYLDPQTGEDDNTLMALSYGLKDEAGAADCRSPESADRGARLADAVVGPQIHLFILDRSPDALDEDVVAQRAFAIHADGDRVADQHVGKPASPTTPLTL